MEVLMVRAELQEAQDEFEAEVKHFLLKKEQSHNLEEGVPGNHCIFTEDCHYATQWKHFWIELEFAAEHTT